MLSVFWFDIQGMIEIDRTMSRLSESMVRLITLCVLDRAGSQGRRHADRALSKRTGLQLRFIRQAMLPAKASGTKLEYKVRERGGDIALRDFDAHETRKGLSARLFGQRKVFASTFKKGGKFPHRVTLELGGHFFVRIGAGRLPIIKQKSGVIIPNEMIKGASADAWQSTIANVLPRRFAHELKRATSIWLVSPTHDCRLFQI